MANSKPYLDSLPDSKKTINGIDISSEIAEGISILYDNSTTKVLYVTAPSITIGSESCVYVFSSPCAVTLPDAIEGVSITLKKLSFVGNVSVSGSIDGGSSYTISTDYDTLRLIGGLNWLRI